MIELKNIVKTFAGKNTEIHAVRGVTLNIEDGDIFGIVGYSGAGKSTLVRIINQLEKQTSGEVIIDGKVISDMSESQLRHERQKIGMIFQHFNLLWSRTVAENIAFPLEIAKVDKATRTKKVQELIRLVGLEGREGAYPSELSGGQKQRVGIARALANDPKILLCDEATSALDNETQQKIQQAINNLKEEYTILIIAHRLSTIINCDKINFIEEGKVIASGTHEELLKNCSEYKHLYKTEILKHENEEQKNVEA